LTIFIWKTLVCMHECRCSRVLDIVELNVCHSLKM
jgi:hypothetical protein